MGSGEMTLNNLLKGIGESLPLLRGGTPEKIEELQTIIPPSRILSDEAGIYPIPENYTGLATFLGTEGCPYNCRFCSSALTSE